MTELVYDCPFCKALKVTFDLAGQTSIAPIDGSRVTDWYIMAVCRHCREPVTLRVKNDFTGNIAAPGNAPGQLSQSGFHILWPAGHPLPGAENAPEGTPPTIAAAFTEGTICAASECYTAAGVMFRKVVDLATGGLLPPHPHAGLKVGTRNRLEQRLAWLFDCGLLAADLRELADAVREDGNDGAHGPALSKADAEDLMEFARLLLERLYAQPARLAAANARRGARRGPLPSTLGALIAPAN